MTAIRLMAEQLACSEKIDSGQEEARNRLSKQAVEAV